MKIASTCQLYSTEIVIKGNDNKLVLEDEVKIQEGKIEITMTCSVVDLHNLLKFLFEKLITIKGYKDQYPYDMLIDIYKKRKDVENELQNVVHKEFDYYEYSELDKSNERFMRKQENTNSLRETIFIDHNESDGKDVIENEPDLFTNQNVF